MHYFLKSIFGIKVYMFRTVPLYIIRSFSLYTQQCYMSYRFVDSLRAGSGRNCPKHVGFYSKNNFEKLVHLVGFIIKIKHIFWITFFSQWLTLSTLKILTFLLNHPIPKKNIKHVCLCWITIYLPWFIVREHHRFWCLTLCNLWG